ncbi:MAG TPA: hypothetical protein VIT20_04395 [Propionibacteriaceae bacterium]
MSQIAYADPKAAKPEVGLLGAPDSGAQEAAGFRAYLLAALPLIISLAVHWIFFIAYWIPETSTFPAHQWWLTQLSPMASKSLTSAGHPQVPDQIEQSGVAGLLLLGCGAAVLWLARTPYWLGRAAMMIPAGIGFLVVLVSIVALVVSGRLDDSGLSVVLMLVWVVSAGYATYRGFLADGPEPRRKTWRSGFGLLVAYALIGPAPVAVGRFMFAPGLRDAADALQQNTVALRLGALWTSSTVLLYLSGLMVGVCLWVAFQWWPPRRRLSFLGLSLTLAGTVILTGWLGWPTNTLAEKRVTTLTYDSPALDVSFTCGSWILDRPDREKRDPQPTQTLVITGFTCRNVTTYSGYRQVSTRTLPAPLAPVHASTPEGVPIQGRTIVAQYDGVVIVGMSTKLTGQANQLMGVRLADSAELWHYTCDSRQALAVRFASVPAGDRPELGHITRRELTPQVVVRCDGKTLGFNPATGPGR